MKTVKFTVKEEELLLFKRRRYARSAVSNAVAKGELRKKGSCELCYERCCTQAHHTDYGQPLKVVWLCSRCHGAAHRKDHPLNPLNHKQTPLPFCSDRYQKVSVSFTIPAANFIAMQREAEKANKPLASLIREEALKKYAVQSPQLEFPFQEENHDQPPQVPNERVQGMAANESLLPQSERPLLPSVRRKRDLNLRGVEGRFRPIS